MRGKCLCGCCPRNVHVKQSWRENVCKYVWWLPYKCSWRDIPMRRKCLCGRVLEMFMERKCLQMYVCGRGAQTGLGPLLSYPPSGSPARWNNATAGDTSGGYQNSRIWK